MNSNAVAVYIDRYVIHWSSVMIFFGVVAFLTMTLSLWKAKNPRSAALGFFFPLAIILSFFSAVCFTGTSIWNSTLLPSVPEFSPVLSLL